MAVDGNETADNSVVRAEEKTGGAFSLPVDLIRVFAIILVVLLHASNEYYTAIQQTPLESALYWWTSTIYKSIALPCVPIFVCSAEPCCFNPLKLMSQSESF